MTTPEQANAAYSEWRGKTSILQPWFLTVAVDLLSKGATAARDAKPSDEVFWAACALVNTIYGSPAYTLPGAKADRQIQFIAALLMIKQAPATGASQADIAAAEKRGFERAKAAMRKFVEGL